MDVAFIEMIQILKNILQNSVLLFICYGKWQTTSLKIAYWMIEFFLRDLPTLITLCNL